MRHYHLKESPVERPLCFQQLLSAELICLGSHYPLHMLICDQGQMDSRPLYNADGFLVQGRESVPTLLVDMSLG